jgi:hypothetical protein
MEVRGPQQEPGQGREAIGSGQISGFSISNQTVIDQREPVATGLEPLPYGHLLIRCQLIKSTGLDGFDQTVQSGVEGIQGHIQRTALSALVCCWIPEFHTSILFEYTFYDKPFSP